MRKCKVSFDVSKYDYVIDGIFHGWSHIPIPMSVDMYEMVAVVEFDNGIVLHISPNRIMFDKEE